MHKELDPRTRHRVHTLHSYITALERGDLETVAAALQEAEQDAVLERMILELHNASQDQTPVLSDDVVPVHTFLDASFRMPQSAETMAVNGSSFSTNSFSPLASQQREEERIPQDMSITEEFLPEKPYVPILAPRRKSRFGTVIQSLAAVLVVGVLLSSFIVLFTLRQTATGGHGKKTPHVKATAMAQATVAAKANIILADPLDHNIHNWLTTPPDVFAFKDGAYHITDRGDQGRATVLQANTFTGPLAYTLTMQEINGDDNSTNNSFGMIFRFTQGTGNGQIATTFYTLEVVNTPGGEYQFWKYDDSKQDPWTLIWHQQFGDEFHSGHGPQSVNTIKVFMDGGKFTFTVNGRMVKAIEDGSLTSGAVGMIVNLNGTEIAFKNLLLTHH